MEPQQLRSLGFEWVPQWSLRPSNSKPTGPQVSPKTPRRHPLPEGEGGWATPSVPWSNSGKTSTSITGKMITHPLPQVYVSGVGIQRGLVQEPNSFGLVGGSVDLCIFDPNSASRRSRSRLRVESERRWRNPPLGCGSKKRYQNGTLVSGNMGQNLRNPSCLRATPTLVQWSPLLTQKGIVPSYTQV